jgi:hypothetical protein
MLPYGVGAIRAPWPIRAQAVCAGEGHHLAEGIMTEKHLPDDLDLNETGLVNRAKGTAEELEGKVQQVFGKAQQKLDDVIDREKH